MKIPDIQQRAALRIEQVSIQQMPGISSSFTFGPLSPGITVIHGPNAIGKSRAAAALQAIVWPDHAPADVQVSGQASTGDVDWGIDVRYGRASWEAKGRVLSVAPVQFASASHSNRYLLTLHELLKVDDKGFAELIQRESAGGFDFGAARRSLGVAILPRPGSAKEKRNYDAARNEVRNIQRDDRLLRDREHDRKSLEEQRAAAFLAEAQVRLLSEAIRHADAVDARRVKEMACEAFPDVVGQLHGDEFETAIRLRDQIAEQSRKLGIERFEISRLEQELATFGFTGDQNPDDILIQLRNLLARIQQGEGETQAIERDLAARHAAVDTTKKLAAPELTPEQFNALNQNGLWAVADLSRRLRDLQNEENAKITLARWLDTDIARDDPEPLRKAIEILTRWLQIPEPLPDVSTIQRWALLAAALVIAGLAAILAIVSNPIWLIMLIAATALGWIAMHRPHSTLLEERQRTEATYRSLGASLPIAWTLDSVLETFAELENRLAAALLEQERSTRWAGLSAEREDIEASRSKLEYDRQVLYEEFGVHLRHGDAEELRNLAESVDRWRKAEEAVAELEGRQKVVRAQNSELLAEANRLFAMLDVPSCSSIIEMEIRIEDVTGRARTAASASAQLQQKQIAAKHIASAMTLDQARMDELYCALELVSGDESSLRSLCEAVQPFRDAQRSFQSALSIEQTHRLAIEADPSLVEQNRSDLDLEKSRQESLANIRDDVVRELDRLDRDLQQARKQTMLEEAVSSELAALESLRDRRDADIATAARWEIAELVHQATRDLNRPRVFHAARDLFSLFTAGAWRLEFDDEVSASFHATETSTRRSRALDQLSSGTRVQLLMAVRIAFLEVSEDGPQLPLILDETLGNADDTRANAIIDATIEIARRGRQVIYFTAQQDEVFKWQTRLDQALDAPEFSRIDLAEARGLSAASQSGSFTWTPNPLTVPSYDPDLTHNDAHSVLRVAPVDFWSKHDDEVDLWYVMHDVETLISLRQLGVTTWGQYCQYGGTLKGGRSIIVTELVHSQAETRLQIISLSRRYWQEGRPRPMTQIDIADSKSVSERFREPVLNLAASFDWNAGYLLDALRDKQVPGFRQNSIDALEEYCASNGLVTDRAPLTTEEIRGRVWVALQQELPDTVCDINEIDEMLLLIATSNNLLNAVE